MAGHRLLAVIIAEVLLCGLASRPAASQDLLAGAAWTARHSAVEVATDEAGQPALEWSLTPTAGTIHVLECDLPDGVAEVSVIRFTVRPSMPCALEVQLATPGQARIYRIIQLPTDEARTVEIAVADMGRFAGFEESMLRGPLLLRFWIDGNPGWAGGAVQQGEAIRLSLSGITVENPFEGLADGINATLAIDPGSVEGRIHPHVYGQFLEHIYHSVVDGLYGELVRNRSFVGGADGFRIEGGTVRQTSGRVDMHLLAGDPSWTDYEFSLRAQKTGGPEGFLIIVRATSADDLYWWNLGGWGNARHALEVEVGGQRGPLPQAVQGAIEAGRWYEIRVRVEGDHIEGWLDGEKLLDVRDATHPRGMVGVGTWATQAEFTDLRVTDLAGNTLPCEFVVPTEASGAEPWVAVPSARVELVRTDSPNTGWSARVDLSKSRGIAQDRINAVEGHLYHGRAWLRREGQVTAAEAILRASDGTVMSRAPLNPGEDGWTECPFTLAVDRNDTNARLEIVGEGTGALLVDMVSLMRDDSIETGCRADLLEAVAALRPPIIRWPGGCFASIYRWKRGIGPQHERKPFYNLPWAEWDDAGFGTDEFIRLCRAVGAEPMIVLNLGSWDTPDRWREYLQDARDWIEYCNGDASTPMGRLRAANGHPEPYNVTHWELDNETWGMGVEAYAERLVPFAEVIRELCPEATIYACSFWQSGDPRLLELVGEHFDILSYHHYEGPANFAGGPKMLEDVWSAYESIIASSRRPATKLAITEWNAQSTDWRTGLYAGGLLNVMERSPVVQMASPALFLRHVDATDWDNAFINLDHKGWFPAPNYVVMKLYQDHFQRNRVALESRGTLNAVATLSEDGQTLVIKAVNYGNAPADCQITIAEPFTVAHGRQWVIAADLLDRNTLDGPDRIKPVESLVEGVGNAFRHTFPRYSVTVMELTR